MVNTNYRASWIELINNKKKKTFINNFIVI